MLQLVDAVDLFTLDADSMPQEKPKTLKQVAALPVRLDRAGRLRVLLITSRETRRLIIPKGWTMKGRKDHRAAAIEARQEAGLIGRIAKKPLGSYVYWKRRSDHFDRCRVTVYVLEMERQLPVWHEKGQRHGAWFLVEDAAAIVDEPGLVPLIRGIADYRPRRTLGRQDPAPASAR